MRLPVVIHKDTDSDYGVTVPDLPGCFSAGNTMDEALENVQEAIECHLEGLLLDGESLPVSRSLDAHKKNRAFKNGTWAIVQVDLSRVSGRAKRVNITIPENLLSQMDAYANAHGETRSGLISQAAIEYMANHG